MGGFVSLFAFYRLGFSTAEFGRHRCELACLSIWRQQLVVLFGISRFLFSGWLASLHCWVKLAWHLRYLFRWQYFDRGRFVNLCEVSSTPLNFQLAATFCLTVGFYLTGVVLPFLAGILLPWRTYCYCVGFSPCVVLNTASTGIFWKDVLVGFNIPLHPRRRLCWCSGFYTFIGVVLYRPSFGAVFHLPFSAIDSLTLGYLIPALRYDFNGLITGGMFMSRFGRSTFSVFIDALKFAYCCSVSCMGFCHSLRLMTRSYNDWWYPIPCANLITALWVIMIRFGKFSFRLLLLSSFFWWDAVVEFAVQGFLGSFRLEMLLFFFGGSATPIASKPVQRTDLVDASESRWGGEKKTDIASFKSTAERVFQHFMHVWPRTFLCYLAVLFLFVVFDFVGFLLGMLVFFFLCFCRGSPAFGI